METLNKIKHILVDKSKSSHSCVRANPVAHWILLRKSSVNPILSYLSSIRHLFNRIIKQIQYEVTFVSYFGHHPDCYWYWWPIGVSWNNNYLWSSNTDKTKQEPRDTSQQNSVVQYFNRSLGCWQSSSNADKWKREFLQKDDRNEQTVF